MDLFLPSIFFLLGITVCAGGFLYINKRYSHKYELEKSIFDEALFDARSRIEASQTEIERLSSSLQKMQAISPDKFSKFVESLRSAIQEYAAFIQSQIEAIEQSKTYCSPQAASCLEDEETKLKIKLQDLNSYSKQISDHVFLSAIFYTIILGSGEQLIKFLEDKLPLLRTLFAQTPE